MVLLTRLFFISRIFFMGFLISGTAFAETSPIEPVDAPISVIEAAADDNVAQSIQASLEPLKSAFPPLLTAPRYRRVDVSRLVMDFYTHRGYRAAWTDDRDVAQLHSQAPRRHASALSYVSKLAGCLPVRSPVFPL